MRRAAAAGRVDFRQADPRDPAWWRYLRLQLDGQADADRLTALGAQRQNLQMELLQLQLSAAAMAAGAQLPPQAAEQLRDRRQDSYQAMLRLLMPWLADDERAAQRSTVQALSAAWEETFGRLDDPVTQAKIQRTVEALTPRPG